MNKVAESVKTRSNIALIFSRKVDVDIVAIDSDTTAATGIGVQLGYATDINTSPTHPLKIWAVGETWDISPPTDGRGSFKITLAARYYKTADQVTPGEANAKVIFNIDYK